MTERIPCTTCGALILPSTAERTNGLCMPCKGGYRGTIEAAIIRREKDKQYRASPAWKHWCSLVERVHKTPTGFAGLSLEEQRFFGLRFLIDEVCNGGFDQYFSNSSGDYYARAVEGLMEIGATESLRLLTEAKRLMFGASSVPRTQAARNAVLPHMDETIAAHILYRWKRLDALDRQFCEDRDGLDERVEKFANDHALRMSNREHS
jgi:Domain of unknown function (DUF4375)